MNAQHLFNAIFNTALVIMLIATVAGLGMSFTVKQILAPLRNVWLVVATVVVNAGLAPLVAIAVCHVLPLHSQARVGVELAAIAAAGPSALKAAELAKRADLAAAVSIVVVLNLVNLVAAPLWAEAIVSGATVKPLSIFGDLVLIVLIPLAIGLALHAHYPEHRDAWNTGLQEISSIALIVMLAFGIAANWKLIISVIGTWVILASVLMTAVWMVLGWAVSFRNRPAAIANSLITLNRFAAIGLVVIASVLHNQGAYLAPALVFSLVVTILLYATGIEIGHRVSRVTHSTPKPAAAAPAPAANAAVAGSTRQPPGG